MTTKKNKTEKYIVVKTHTLGHKVGDVIELTETKAKSLVGKVRLQSEGVENVTTSGASKKLKDENALLLKRIDELEEELESADDTVKSMEAAAAEGKAKIADLEAQLKSKAK